MDLPKSLKQRGSSARKANGKAVGLFVVVMVATAISAGRNGVHRLFVKPGSEFADANLGQMLRATKQPFTLIVDIRDPKAFELAHIPHAKNIPVDQLQRQYERLRGASSILIYGERDNVELSVAEKCFVDMRLGDRTAAFRGGWEEWAECGLAGE